MVIKYSYIKKINKLISPDTYYRYWIGANILGKGGKNKLVSLVLKNVNINLFRYFFWIFNSINVVNKININKCLIYYKYLLNYVFLLQYLKLKKVNYYNYFCVLNLKNTKQNKKIQRKFIRYLILKKNVKILFFFKKGNYNIDFFFNSLNKSNLKIYELYLLNPNLMYFFFYLSFFS